LKVDHPQAAKQHHRHQQQQQQQTTCKTRTLHKWSSVTWAANSGVDTETKDCCNPRTSRSNTNTCTHTQRPSHTVQTTNIQAVKTAFIEKNGRWSSKCISLLHQEKGRRFARCCKVEFCSSVRMGLGSFAPK
jgi:hypothetical protein